ncbi:MAG: hypothetical protein KKA90_02280 [Nanoarchaeota archaeon]|nr:hypothetical protein [Nanoarchaeota archaeon]
MKFLLDTNFLMIPGRFKVDVITELRQFEGERELYTIDLVVEELERLADGTSKDARCAALALHLIQLYKIEVIQTQGQNADDELLQAAQHHQVVVCTQDAPLQKRLTELKLPFVHLRQKRTLVLENYPT